MIIIIIINKIGIRTGVCVGWRGGARARMHMCVCVCVCVRERERERERESAESYLKNIAITF